MEDKTEYISKQDTIKAIEEIIGNEAGYKAWAILNAVRKMPTAERWIPVSEKLPKVRRDVLLHFADNMAVGFYSRGDWNVNTGNGFYTGLTSSEDQPIAWMPLPEPMQQEADDGK